MARLLNVSSPCWMRLEEREKEMESQNMEGNPPEVEESTAGGKRTAKALDNTDENLKNKSKVELAGNAMGWICVGKAWCKEEDWMHSTKVFRLPTGCLVQVSTQQGDNVTTALCFVLGAVLTDFTD